MVLTIWCLVKIALRWEATHGMSTQSSKSESSQKGFSEKERVDKESKSEDLEGGGGGENCSIVIHEVKDADTLAGLHVHYGVGLSTLKKFNDFPGENFKSCKRLRIPSNATPMVRVIDPQREAERRLAILYRKFQQAARRKVTNAQKESKQEGTEDLGLNLNERELLEETSSAQAKFYIDQIIEECTPEKDDEKEQCSARTATPEQWSIRESELLENAVQSWFADLRWEARAKPVEAYPADANKRTKRCMSFDMH